MSRTGPALAADPATPPAPSALVQALLRSMPLTRLLDCGMAHPDATGLHSATAAGRAWDAAAEELADLQLARAHEATREDRLATARISTRRALGALVFAQMAFNEDTQRKRELYDRYVDVLAQLAALSQPAIERLELPYRDGRLVGWLVLPASGSASATVVVWGGLSGWGAAYLRFADALTERGVACLLAEGPGQGEARLRHGLGIDEHVAEGFSRFVDAVGEHPRLGASIGVRGNSFGGLFAAHVAAGDARVGACCINGAPATPAVPDFRTAREQMTAAAMTTDLDRVRSVFEALRFDPARVSLTCPTLILHGGMDPLATLDQQQPFVDAAGENGTLRVWPDGEHTIYNRAEERDAYAADWFVERLT